MQRYFIILIILLVVLSVSSLALADPHGQQHVDRFIGGGLGAALGGLAGSSIGSGRGQVAAIIIGSSLGSVLGQTLPLPRLSHSSRLPSGHAHNGLPAWVNERLQLHSTPVHRAHPSLQGAHLSECLQLEAGVFACRDLHGQWRIVR